jgi:hypothetical protein
MEFGIYEPLSAQRELLKGIIKALIGDPEFKAELSNNIRMEIEASRAKYARNNAGGSLSYDMLTRTNVDLQTRFAASGYDVYGKTIIPENGAPSFTNGNIYRDLKNKTHWATSPSKARENRGQRSVAKGGY